MPRAALALSLAVPVLSGCGFFGNLIAPRSPEPGPSQSVYRAAMADFSDCATTTDLATRAAIAGRLAQAAATLQAETRPTDPDHFFMTDRVSAAAEYCTAAAR
ncbi:hypothetical protein C7455_103231 [Roseicyclus mahoneyensis]|jgi:hypothetical protein|uniref:Lipoprotein n=2 Tax=Roseicyclus mahoneyensis TaxID=164332 RepID=A0A316GJR9_9RHOB|nr:hypothetical protein C7455_103231 [Roseicyclus mahoneyensis]